MCHSPPWHVVALVPNLIWYISVSNYGFQVRIDICFQVYDNRGNLTLLKTLSLRETPTYQLSFQTCRPIFRLLQPQSVSALIQTTGVNLPYCGREHSNKGMSEVLPTTSPNKYHVSPNVPVDPSVTGNPALGYSMTGLLIWDIIVVPRWSLDHHELRKNIEWRRNIHFNRVRVLLMFT